jgi:hypothetical protein
MRLRILIPAALAVLGVVASPASAGQARSVNGVVVTSAGDDLVLKTTKGRTTFSAPGVDLRRGTKVRVRWTRVAGERVATRVQVRRTSSNDYGGNGGMTADTGETFEVDATIAALPGAEVPPILLVTLADGSNLKVQATGVDLTGLAVGQKVELKLALTGSADGTAVLTLVRIHAEDQHGDDNDDDHGGNCDDDDGHHGDGQGGDDDGGDD